MTRGCGCDGSLRAMRNRRLAAAASRNADSRKSMVAPVELMARLEVTPTALDSNICLINAPGFVGRLKMTPQSLFQFGTVWLHPTPDRRVIRLQTALGEQLFDIAQRQRVPEIPAHGTKNQLRRRLPPLEDCRSGCVLHGLFSLPAFPPKVATHPLVDDRDYPGNAGHEVASPYLHRLYLVARVGRADRDLDEFSGAFADKQVILAL